MMATSIPPGFEALWAELGRSACDGVPGEKIDGSEVREVSITVTGWVDADKPLAAYAGVVECAARGAGMRVESASVQPVRGF